MTKTVKTSKETTEAVKSEPIQGETSKPAKAVKNPKPVKKEISEVKEEPIQPKPVELPQVTDKETIVVNSDKGNLVANTEITEPKKIIHHDVTEEKLPELSTKEDAYETFNYKELKKVTGHKITLKGVIYVGIKR